jgi:ethanolamine ammonia-lyase small subunit
MESRPPARRDPWLQLKDLTPARIALGRAGGSLPTRELLAFQRAHAQARDAVQHPFNPHVLADAVSDLGLPTVVVSTAAPDRKTYLTRPDLGRCLASDSRDQLVAQASSADIAIIVSDGLSAPAAERQALPLLKALLPLLRGEAWTIAPVVVATHARVAIEDEVGWLLGAKAAIILLGERPGLSSPDSLGAYLVYDPRPGRTDADRNCISNIRADGLTPAAAASSIHYLLKESLRRRISGIALKDLRPALPERER